MGFEILLSSDLVKNKSFFSGTLITAASALIQNYFIIAKGKPIGKINLKVLNDQLVADIDILGA